MNEPVPQSIHELVSHQAQLSPHHVAVVWTRHRSALNGLINILAALATYIHHSNKPALTVLSDAEKGFRMLGVMMAKFERASLAMQAKCEYIGGFIPYDYQLVDDDKTLIEVSEG